MKHGNISAVVIAKDEEKNLEECLKSLLWLDEILLFDDRSTDKTPKIAQKLGAKVFNIHGKDFADRKNIAFSKVKTDWFLSIDADERVTPELQSEIENIVKINAKEFSAYAIPRKNIILGKELKRGWWPDYVIRLFRKKDFIKVVGELHEQPKFNGNVGYLTNPLIHLKHDNLSEMVEKTNLWSEVEASLMFKANHPKMNIPRFITAIGREFWQRFVRDKAFLDGTEGVIYGIYQVYSRFMSYAKLWEMQSTGNKVTKSQN